MADKILFRRGPESSIPVLDLGEPGITTDTNKLFVGTGTKNIGIPTSKDLESYVPLSQAGAKNGVATLDQNGKLSSSEKPTYTASEVGARPSTWTPSAADVGAIPASQVGANGGIATLGEDGKLTESQRPIITPEGIGAIPESKIGTPKGVVPLGSNGLIAAQYIPGGLDEIKEYDNREAFPPTGEDNIYYLAKDTNLLYRWSGSDYAPVSPSLALGETSTTAYRGDHGLAAYNHSLVTNGNPHGTTAAQVGAIPATEKATANGVATLDESGKLAPTQKPTYTADEVGARPSTWTPSAADVGADPTGTAVSAISTHDSDGNAHKNLLDTKQDKLTGTQGQIVGFDSTGKAVAQNNSFDTSTIFKLIYPIGSIYLSTSPTNPGTIFTGTSWEAYAQGKTIIGVDTSDSDFNEAEKIGGAKTISLAHTHATSGHILTVAEMPNHTHNMGAHTHYVSLSTSNDSHTHSMRHSHSDTFSISGNSGGHNHYISGTTGSNGPSGAIRCLSFNSSQALGDFSKENGYFDQTTPGTGKTWGTETFQLNGDHTHSFTAQISNTGVHSHTISGSVSTYSGSTGSNSHGHTVAGDTEEASGTTNSTGSGTAHSHGDTGSALGEQSVLGPYITCYIWRRTA